MLVNLFNGGNLLADVAQLKLIDCGNAREGTVEVLHFLAVCTHALCLNLHPAQHLSQLCQLLCIVLYGILNGRGIGGLDGCCVQRSLTSQRSQISQASQTTVTGHAGNLDAFILVSFYVSVVQTSYHVSVGCGFLSIRDRYHTTSDDDGSIACHPIALCRDSLLLWVVRYFLCDPFKTRDEEYEDFRTHTDEQHQVGSRNMSQFEERTQDDDCGTPAVGVLHESLSCKGVHPFLQMEYGIHFCHDVCCFNIYNIMYMPM